MPAEPAADLADNLHDLAMAAKAWPFDEARKLLARVGDTVPEKGYVLFETGYGPSGLPHIGTFAEVVRTTMVRQAFQRISDTPTKLFAFSDDMDGLRKVPDNVPNQALLAEHLGKPLTAVPDPFETHESFGAHNNDRLKGFLDSFGFDYEFISSTECYKAGRFDAALLKVLETYDKVRNVILPTLGPDRRKTYSPFLPVCPKTGRVLQVPVTDLNLDTGTITYQDEDGSSVEVPVTGGHCKLQWKADWAMRWAALEVDYEMSGKDLIDSVRLSGQITKILGGRPPEGFTYELFLDENGEKISKSKGNGLTVEEWLAYAPQESLALYMFGQPRRAKRLSFDVIPKHVDDYLAHVAKYPEQSPAEQLENPAWHIHNGAPPAHVPSLGFALLLNLTSVANAEKAETLWGFISNYVPGATPENEPMLARLVEHALAYYRDFVKPAKQYRKATDYERDALRALLDRLAGLRPRSTEKTIQGAIYAIGNKFYKNRLREWFGVLYEVMLGQNQGPRMGTFFKLIGLDESLVLVNRAIERKRIDAHKIGTYANIKKAISIRKELAQLGSRKNQFAYAISLKATAKHLLDTKNKLNEADQLIQTSIQQFRSLYKGGRKYALEELPSAYDLRAKMLELRGELSKSKRARRESMQFRNELHAKNLKAA